VCVYEVVCVWCVVFVGEGSSDEVVQNWLLFRGFIPSFRNIEVIFINL
jgi:hypothetical protein